MRGCPAVSFYNETHLSEIGAKKFTEMLNRDIKQAIITRDIKR
jgi:hypothetical protein